MRGTSRHVGIGFPTAWYLWGLAISWVVLGVIADHRTTDDRRPTRQEVGRDVVGGRIAMLGIGTLIALAGVTVAASTRLSIVALLAPADWIEFSFVRDQLGLSDSALSKLALDPQGRRLRGARTDPERPAPPRSGAADRGRARGL